MSELQTGFNAKKKNQQIFMKCSGKGNGVNSKTSSVPSQCECCIVIKNMWEQGNEHSNVQTIMFAFLRMKAIVNQKSSTGSEI